MHPERIVSIGINYLLVEYEERIDPSINAAVSQLWQQISEQNWSGIESVVPTYRSLLVQYNPVEWAPDDLETAIRALIPQQNESLKQASGRLVVLPVLYGGSHGPDLEDVASFNNLTQNQVISIHQSSIYRVYMLGFNPGYPYLGGLDSRISMPRLEVPRTKVPAGSVAIGGEQTGIYSTPSPGGWRLIGHTPVPLFNPSQNNPVLLRPGDNIQFRSVREEEYFTIVEQVDSGIYQVEINAGE